jgi:hypothetical protein
MAIPREQKEGSHDHPEDQRTSNELARLIRKLRWIGMEDVAEPLMDELTRRGTMDTVSVIAPSRETD